MSTSNCEVAKEACKGGDNEKVFNYFIYFNLESSVVTWHFCNPTMTPTLQVRVFLKIFFLSWAWDN